MRSFLGLVALIVALFANVACGSLSSDNPTGEWEFVETTVSFEDGIRTDKAEGTASVDDNKFSAKIKYSIGTELDRDYEFLSGQYFLDADKKLAVLTMLDSDNEVVNVAFKYKLFKKDGAEYLELDFSVEDTLKLEPFNKIPNKEMDRMLGFKFSYLLRRI